MVIGMGMSMVMDMCMVMNMYMCMCMGMCMDMDMCMYMNTCMDMVMGMYMGMDMCMCMNMGMGMGMYAHGLCYVQTHAADMVLTGMGDHDDHGSTVWGWAWGPMPCIHPHSKEKQSASFLLRCICGVCLPLPHRIPLRRPPPSLHPL